MPTVLDIEQAMLLLEPVSYTHLDVYKRQVMDVSVEPDGGPATHSGVSVLRSPASPA